MHTVRSVMRTGCGKSCKLERLTLSHRPTGMPFETGNVDADFARVLDLRVVNPSRKFDIRGPGRVVRWEAHSQKEDSSLVWCTALAWVSVHSTQRQERACLPDRL